MLELNGLYELVNPDPVKKGRRVGWNSEQYLFCAVSYDDVPLVRPVIKICGRLESVTDAHNGTKLQLAIVQIERRKV